MATSDMTFDLKNDTEFKFDDDVISLADLCPPGSVLVDVIIDQKGNDLYVMYIDEEEEDLSYSKAASLEGPNTLQ